MSEYANGSANPLNMMHAAYAFGACVAPLAVLACHKLGGENGWRLALEISIVLLTASFIFGLFMKMDDDKSTKTGQKSATDYDFSAKSCSGCAQRSAFSTRLLRLP